MASLFIDGEWASGTSGATSQVINPFDQALIAEVDVADDVDVARAILAARRTFDAGDWSGTSATERGALLNRVADLLQRDREEIARTETLNTGKAIREGRSDVDDVSSVFRYYAGLADKDAGRVVATGSATAISRIVYEPVGVCALISPWNYPLLQASWKVAPALAAGNTFVLKPAQVTPLTAIHLVRILAEAGLPKGVGNLLLGPGERIGATLAESSAVDLVSFTGGGVAGRSIMRAAAGNVKKVALELGGKSPNIVFADADFETAVDYALTAAFLHSGQVCSAGCRAIVEDSIYDAFVGRGSPANGADPARQRPRRGTETGPLISAAHLAKVEGYVRIGREEGARLVAGGSRPSEPGAGQRVLLPADGLRRLPAGHADRPGGDLRPGPDDRTVHDRGRGGRDRQRHDLRPGRRSLDGRSGPRPAGSRATPPWNDLDQRLSSVSSPGGVGWLQAVGHRS